MEYELYQSFCDSCGWSSITSPKEIIVISAGERHCKEEYCSLNDISIWAMNHVNQLKAKDDGINT